MKKLFGLAILLTANIAFAEEVEITSFVFAGSRTRSAEVCGKISGVGKQGRIVKLTVDENSKNPGVYYSLAGSDGKFCHVVVSYKGTVSASLEK